MQKKTRVSTDCRYLCSPLVAAAANATNIASVTSRVRRSSFACAFSRSPVLFLSSGTTHVGPNKERATGQVYLRSKTRAQKTHLKKKKKNAFRPAVYTAAARPPSSHGRRPTCLAGSKTPSVSSNPARRSLALFHVSKYTYIHRSTTKDGRDFHSQVHIVATSGNGGATMLAYA